MLEQASEERKANTKPREEIGLETGRTLKSDIALGLLTIKQSPTACYVCNPNLCLLKAHPENSRHSGSATHAVIDVQNMSLNLVVHSVPGTAGHFQKT